MGCKRLHCHSGSVCFSYVTHNCPAAVIFLQTQQFANSFSGCFSVFAILVIQKMKSVNIAHYALFTCGAVCGFGNEIVRAS